MTSRLMLDATLNAATCEHISAAKYINMDSTANSTAIQPLNAISRAAEKSGATSSASFTTSQMNTNDTSASSALSADKTHERYVRRRYPPAYSMSLGNPFFFIGFDLLRIFWLANANYKTPFLFVSPFYVPVCVIRCFISDAVPIRFPKASRSACGLNGFVCAYFMRCI